MSPIVTWLARLAAASAARRPARGGLYDADDDHHDSNGEVTAQHDHACPPHGRQLQRSDGAEIGHAPSHPGTLELAAFQRPAPLRAQRIGHYADERKADAG